MLLDNIALNTMKMFLKYIPIAVTCSSFPMSPSRFTTFKSSFSHETVVESVSCRLWLEAVAVQGD